MIGVEFSVQDSVSPAISELAAGMNADELANIAGQAGANVYQRHLIDLNKSRPNALGGRRTNFYANAARATNFRPVPGGVLISINQVGLALRYFGGVVRPVQKKYLTVPAVKEAHGKTAADFGDLVLVYGRNGEPYALARPDYRSLDRAAAGVGGQRGRAIGEKKPDILFWLEKETKHEPDPSVLPPQETVLREIGRTILSHANRVWQRAIGAPRGRTLSGEN